MQIKPVRPINVTDEGEVEIHLAPDAANDDWIRARRLQEKAEAGDDEAKKEFERLNDISMIEIVSRD